MVAKRVTVSDTVLGSLNTPHSAFYVYGEVRYMDAFSKPHYLKYRMIYGGPCGVRTHVDPKGVRCGMLCMDTQGNEAD
jgi:hypothetical protein